MKPIHVAFVWHMHQPYYKDDLTSTYLLPWVRLRCAKDYYKMPALLDGYPKIRATFNLVPSLLAQIEDYGKEESVDLFLNLSKRNAAELSAEERDFVLRWMRESPRALRVQQSPRYLELASRPVDAQFTTADIRDLQVWFNLAWCDPVWVESDPILAELKRKDRDFSEGDKQPLFTAQLDMMAKVIPKYRQLADRGQAELTFSPYYHPILPLIIHVDSARSANPQIQLPEHHFSHREDAERQIELGLGLFERLLGRRPKGMWPSELAVGESVIGLATGARLDWMISDEEVLARSMDSHYSRDDHLYSPMRVGRDGPTVAMVFRDSQISNAIGFDYQRMSSTDAARSLVGRLKRIGEQQGDRELLVTIALDGENAWEFYPRDGHDFLNALYTELESSRDIVTTTVGDFIAEHPPQQQLHHLHTGSWIAASLDTWIGDPEHNVAWDLLAETREWLEDQSQQRPKDSDQVALAWREILITEGSDWFWWFSRKHDSGMDLIWDNQFRLHLRNVYKLMGSRAPARLFQPIIKRAPAPERGVPAATISPVSRDDPEWTKAGYYLVGSGFGALHRPAGFVERVYYGNDAEQLYFRIDTPRSPAELANQHIDFWLYCSGAPAGDGASDTDLPLSAAAMADLGFEPTYAVRIVPRSKGGTATVIRIVEPAGPPQDSEKERSRGVAETAWEVTDPFFVAIPFKQLGKRPGDTLEMALVVSREGSDIEVVPPAGSLGVRVPGEALATAVPHSQHLKVLVATAELAPFAKLGGVADVAAALSKELRRLGHDVRVVLPRYRQVDIGRHNLRPVITGLQVPMGAQKMEATIYEGRLGELVVYFVDCPPLYDRDGIIGFGDDDARSVFFSRALLEMLPELEFFPDVIHVHDWYAALVPNLLDRVYSQGPYAEIATNLTIHNLSAQGVFGFGALMLAGLEEWGLIRVGIPGLDNVVNVLGRGIHFADIVNTVSERYAAEIQTPDYGEGLDELLRRNAHKLHGVVNGIDYEIFDPQRDPNLPHHYSADAPEGKALLRAELRAELGLDDVNKPVCAIVSRFYDVKGIDLVEQSMTHLLELGLQVVVIGSGDRRYEDMFRRRAAEVPHQVSASIGFDPRLVQRIYAGADMLWMPSRFEPCGLAQLIALRYGTIPVVRETGGLADTIRDYDPVAATGNGFVFDAYDPWQFFAAVVRAAETYRHPQLWAWLVRRAMTEDVSWSRSAHRYVQLYLAAITARRERRGVTALAD
ncbi:MAG TPA: glycogen/starch synthase [Candidatus Dormibacteraeota bacterium]|jgi:starch synthase|nr:glycogen/starch synthase [Candidatus Dormibacteraeota bacterium]